MYSSPTANTQAPGPFASFGRQRRALIDHRMMLYPEKARTGPVRDTLLDEAASGVSSRRVISLFLLGLGAGLLARRPAALLLGKLGPHLRKSGLPLNENIFSGIQSKDRKLSELNISESNTGLTSLVQLVSLDPRLWKPIVGYLATTISGYASGTFAQGAQEAWVRREETKIRAKLINQLTRVFTQSIRLKNQFDNQLHEEAKARVLTVLQKHGIPQAARYVQAGPLTETPSTHLRSFYEPVNRLKGAAQSNGFAGLSPQSSLSPALPPPVPQAPASFSTLQPTAARPELSALAGALPTPANARFGYGAPLKFGQSIEECLSEWAEGAASAQGWHARSMQGAIAGAGVLTGLALSLLGKLFTPGRDRTFQGVAYHFQTVNVNGLEGMALRGFARRENLPFMLGFFLLAGLGKLGKLFVDGLREIEVTRANARTELSYQGHLWLTQDPHYHGIAVQEAMENELSLLDQELAAGLRNPAAIKQRVDSILAVGLKAAPPYWPMIPSVQLVAARG